MEEKDPLPPVNQYIYLVDNRQDSRIIKITDNKQFRWRKTPIPIKDISKFPFFTLLEVGNQKLTEVEWDCQQEDPLIQGDEDEDEKNNKQIFVISEPQKLQIEEIEKKKKELRPQELIEELVQNNEQYKKRTQYSKQKYLKKKQKKYMFRFHTQPVSLANIHKHYFSNQKESIFSIRWDMFALLMLYSGPYKRVLLAEQGKGLLLGGVMTRKWEKITVVSGKNHPTIKNYPIVDQLNIQPKYQEKVSFVEWQTLKSQSSEQSLPQYDNCILMGNYSYEELCDLLHPFLSQSAIVTYYCHSLSLLEEAARLMKIKGYLNVRIFDSWCREYQVLKNRTHPMMNMNSCSGYLLTAIAVK